MRIEEGFGWLMAVAIILLFAGAVVAAIWRGIVAVFRGLFRKAEQPILIDEDELERSLQVARTPRPVVGTSQWMHYECKPVFCDAPLQRSELVVHNRQDPAHRAECQECREGVKLRHSGVSYRSN